MSVIPRSATAAPGLTVCSIQAAEAATAFLSQVKVANRAALQTTLSGAVVYIVGWHLKDDEMSMSVSAIKDMLKTGLTSNMPKVKRAWASAILNSSQKLAAKLCYTNSRKGKVAQYGGIIHTIAECHTPETALEALITWAESEGLHSMEALEIYLGYKKGSKSRAKAREAAKGADKLLTALTDDLANAKIKLEHTEDAAQRAQLAQDYAMAIAVSAPDREVTAKYLFEEMDVAVLDRVIHMGQAILDRKLAAPDKPAKEGKQFITSKGKRKAPDVSTVAVN